MSGDPFGVIGTVIDGQFRVDQWVGEGGFSSVYKGFHLGLQEPIAIKCLKLPPALGREVIEQFQNRFRDESRIAYRLSQGNLHIVRSITSGTTTSQSGQVIPYMVLEWLEGLTFGQDLKKRRDAGMTGRPLEEVVQIFAPAAEALAYAHAHGVVHRDIKPGNLFLAQTREGYRLKVLDFGMAKILSDGNIGIAPMAQSTGSLVIFSAPYAAPEQFDAKIGPIGTWTDVYSLALVLLEAMRDKRVRNVDSIAECLMHAVDPGHTPTPRKLGLTVSDALNEVFARALAVNPRERAQDVGEFWGQLRNAMLRDAEDQAIASHVDSVPPGIDGEGDAPATIVADTSGMFANEDEPTRNVDLNSPAFAQGGGLPPEVKDFLSRAQQQSARSQDAGGQTMAMQSPAAGAPWPPTPLPAAGRPLPAAGRPAAAPAPQSRAQSSEMLLDANGEPQTMAMHSPLANQLHAQAPPPPSPGGMPGLGPGPGGMYDQLNSPQFQNAAALGMTMPLVQNSPIGAGMGGGYPPQGGGYPGPAPAQSFAGPPPGQMGMGPGMPGPGQGMGPGMGQMPGPGMMGPGMPGPGMPGPGMGAGGYVAPGWAPQQGAISYGAPPAPSSKMPIILAAVVAAIAILGGGLYFAVRLMESRQEVGTTTATTIDAGVAAVDTNAANAATALPTTTAIPTAVTTDSTPLAPTAALTAPTAGAVDTSHPIPNANTAGNAAGTHPAQPANPGAHPVVPTPTPTPAPTPVAPANDGGFDQAAAQRSLHNMEGILASCKQPGGPSGAGQVRVTFANDGSAMSSLVVGPPYEGTPVGDCAASRFKMARVPKFDGPPGVSNYTFHLAK